MGIWPLEKICWTVLSSVDTPEQVAAFYYDRCGGRIYVENWFIAARRGHALICAWHQVFLQLWSRRGPYNLSKHGLFQGVDLSHLRSEIDGGEESGYLTMHACFAKLVHKDRNARRMWQEEMLLLRADDTAFWHVCELQWDLYTC